MIEIKFFWNDLRKAKQNEILRLLGNNHNWDKYPIFIFQTEEEPSTNQEIVEEGE